MNYVLIAALFVLVGVVLAGLAYWYIRMRSNPSTNDMGAEPIDTVTGWQPRVTRVMTAAEQQAYDTLRLALPDYLVLSQVPLSRFMKVTTRNSYSEWLRRVGNQCADLVVCDRQSKVFAVIEVREAAADTSPRAIKRNKRKARSLKEAGIALHLWPAHALPNEKQVRELLWSSSDKTTDLAGLAPAASTRLVMASSVPIAKPALSEAANHDAVVVDDATEFNDAPPSTWFDDLDSSPMPLGTSASAGQTVGPR